MAISTFSFFLPLPFFAAAGGFGGAAAFAAFGALGAFGAPPAAPTKARVLLRSSIAASAARALMIAIAAYCARSLSLCWCSNGWVALVSQLAPRRLCLLVSYSTLASQLGVRAVCE